MTATSKEAKAEVAAIRAILHGVWDPIGCGVPVDEYDTYLWSVLALLERNASREEITAYLRWAADVAMSSPVPEERLMRVVDMLLGVELSGRSSAS
jgi:hypothetical protein